MTPTLSLHQRLTTLPDKLKALRHSRPAMALGCFTVLAVIWLGIILPLNHAIQALRADIAQQTANLYDLRRMGGDIKTLERLLSDEQRKGSVGSPLQQLERLAQQHRLSSRMSRVAPVRLPDGRTALDVTFDDVSLAVLTPFLHGLTFQSLLRLESLTLRTGGQAGTTTAQLRITGDGA
jgi:type II secretory pathway component PulM